MLKALIFDKTEGVELTVRATILVRDISPKEDCEVVLLRVFVIGECGELASLLFFETSAVSVYIMDEVVKVNSRNKPSILSLCFCTILVLLK